MGLRREGADGPWPQRFPVDQRLRTCYRSKWHLEMPDPRREETRDWPSLTSCYALLCMPRLFFQNRFLGCPEASNPLWHIDLVRIRNRNGVMHFMQDYAWRPTAK